MRSVTTTALGACLSKKSGRKRQVPALRFLENGPQGGRRRGLHRPGSPLSPMSSSSSPEGVGGRSGKYEVLEDEPNRRGRGRMRALAPVDQEGPKGDVVVREGPRLSRSGRFRQRQGPGDLAALLGESSAPNGLAEAVAASAGGLAASAMSAGEQAQARSEGVRRASMPKAKGLDTAVWLSSGAINSR